MSRLSFMISLLFAIALAYVGYISNIALAESRGNKEALRDLAIKMAQGKPDENVLLPLDVLAFAKKRQETVTQLLSQSALSGEQAKVAGSLMAQAAAKMDSAAGSGGAGALGEALALMREAESLVPQKEEQAGVKEALPAVPARADFPDEVTSEESPAQASAGGIYRVQRGENLWQISKKLYRTPWRWHLLWKANEARIPNYRRIPAGFALKLPS